MCGSKSLEHGWRYFFYFSGGFSILGLLISILLMYDFPSQHPWISEEEKNYIEETTYKQIEKPSQLLKVGIKNN